MSDIKNEKQLISMVTGVPVSLLTGETTEDNIELARSFLAFKRDYKAQHGTTKEQFASWLNVVAGIEEPDTANEALTQIEESLRLESGGYPRVPDNGEPIGRAPDRRPTREQFAEWFGGVAAFDPFNDPDGWRRK